MPIAGLNRSSILPKSAQGQWIILGCLLIVIFSINFITMPKQIYIGDPVAVKHATASLIEKKDISVSPDIAKHFGERGKYFYENKRKNKWYSKFGIMNTIMFVPPLIIEKLYTGSIKSTYCLEYSFYLNMYNILLSLLIAFFLFKIVSFYTDSHIIKIIFVLFTFYSTFIWNYLRAQTSEIFQLLFFSAFYYYLIKFRKISFQESLPKRESFDINILFCVLFLLFLTLTKLIYILLIPALFIFVFFAEYNFSVNIFSYAKQKIFTRKKKYLIFLFIASVGVAIVILYINYYKFGAPLKTGYQQWLREKDLFATNLWEGIAGYLFDIQRSIFIHFPILIFSFFGIRRFFRKNPFDLIFIYLIFLIFLAVNAKFINWRGEWCYGPRYLLFILPILSLPFVETLSLLFDNFKKGCKRVLVILIIGILIYSTLLQINVNNLEFFTFYRIRGLFAQIYFDKEELELKNAFDRINNYFQHTHFGIINRDLIAYKINGKKFYPLEQIRSFFNNGTIKRFEADLRNRIQFNYFWLTRGNRHF